MIKDPIIRGNLEEFKSEYSLEGLTEDDAFEHFIHYLVFHRFNSEVFDDVDYLEQINIDDGKNFGIDGIGFLINNTLVFNDDHIVSFKASAQKFPSLSADFVFTQAKTSPKFDSGDILKFTTAVKAFLSESELPNAKTDIVNLRELKGKILDYDTLNCINKSESPKCHLYYVTTGKKAEDDLITSIIEREKKEIEEANPIFKEVSISLIGREELIRFYQEYLNQVEGRVEFKERIDLGEIVGVGKAFLGYIKATEFLKLITDEQLNFRRNIFYENVRDFKGEDNKVNKDISNSIKNVDLKDKFALLNNGVTIVAKLVDTNYQGGEIKIVNYQIVNGCQTSNIIYLNRDLINEKILLPLKLIECINNDITSEITKGTNNQNQVPEESFIALENFPKTLQSFFENISKESPQKIYYERRSREYDFIQPRINQTRIFHLHKVIRAVIAMFVEQPHSCHRYPGELYKQTKSAILGKNKTLFTEDQSPYPYYTACYAWYTLEHLFDMGEIYKKYKPFKFHILLCMKLLIDKPSVRSFDNLREAEKHCKSILESIWDAKTTKKYIITSCSLIESTIRETNRIKKSDKPRSSEFTSILKSKIKTVHGR
jgi:hypothetical protein